MRRAIVFLAITLSIILLTACAGQSGTAKESSTSNVQKETSVVETEQGKPKATDRTLKMIVQGQEIFITLYDTPTANALYEALPMKLSFSDFNGTEKIAYPPEKLATKGEPDGTDPDVGDLCYYAPWGNLCIFYKDFGYSQSLIKIGRVESGMDVLSEVKGDFTATLEKVE